MMNPFVRMSLTLASLSVSACSTLSFGVVNLPAHFSASRRTADIAFGSAPWQRLDVYQPARLSATAAVPVIVFWYGGGWTQGSKDNYRFVGDALAGLGYVAVLPRYRLYPQVRFPQFLQDGAQAVAWIERHVRELGGDPHRIVLMGHSAGAWQAAMLAINQRYLQQEGADPSDVVGLIGLSGPYELRPNSATLDAIFSAPYAPHDWQVLPYVSAASPPALLIQGGADSVVAPSNTERLAEALRARSVPVQVRIYPNRHHADTVAALSRLLRWRAPTLQDIAEFMRSLSGRSARAADMIRTRAQR
jgi:acetyl esterase/lipase